MARSVALVVHIEDAEGGEANLALGMCLDGRPGDEARRAPMGPRRTPYAVAPPGQDCYASCADCLRPFYQRLDRPRTTCMYQLAARWEGLDICRTMVFRVW